MNPQERLLELLKYKRPDGSQTEEMFVHKFIECYPHTKFGPMENIVIVIPGDDETLFSCHTDTVHHTHGIQKLMFDPMMGVVYKNDGECLGADDTTGVWLMLEMIDAKVPGTYVFHRGEERGGIGSSWLAKHEPDFLKKFKRAVAFDRKGTTSVITHQAGGRCCSDVFADALCVALGDEWEPDDGGIFTDTANYTELIPECTNLSIGYDFQHTKDEMQNVEFALCLRELVINLDWQSLPTERDPEDIEIPDLFSGRLFRSNYNRRSLTFPLTLNEALDSSDDELADLVYEAPEYALDILIEAIQALRGPTFPLKDEDHDFEQYVR